MVLIIGILASVALPQYTTAVEKARLAEALTTTKYVYDMMKVQKLTCGANADCMYAFDSYLELPDMTYDGTTTFKSKNFTYDFDMQICVDRTQKNQTLYTFCVFSLGEWSDFGQDQSKFCQSNSDIGNKICKSMEKDGYQAILH